MYFAWVCYTVLLLISVSATQTVFVAFYLPQLNFLGADAQREHQQEGLSQELIDAITEVEGRKGEVCSICLEIFTEGQKVKELPGCNHQFHINCIALWLLRSRICPFCKQEITEANVRAQAGGSR